MKYVVDVNVPMVSDGKSPQATQQCVLNCVSFIERLKNSHKLILDSRSKILQEYTNKLSSRREDSLSREFFRWVMSIHADPAYCEKVNICPNRQRGFDEFPTDNKLRRFHWDDRKYIAVAIAHSEKPEIAQAVDNKWRPFERDLRRHGVRILFL